MDVKTEIWTLLLVIIGVEKESERKSRLTAAGLSFLLTDGSGEEVAQRVLDYLIRNGQARMVSFLQALQNAPLLDETTKQRVIQVHDQIKAFTRNEWQRLFTGTTPITRSYQQENRTGLDSTDRVLSPDTSAGIEPSSGATSRGASAVNVAQNVNEVNGGTVVGVQQNVTITVGGETDLNKLIMLMAHQAKSALPTINEQIRLDVATPNRVIVQRAFAIGVAIKQRTSPPLNHKDLPNVTSGEGEVFRHHAEEVIRYRVEISSAECEIPKPSYTFYLKPATDSPVRFFQLIPKHAGPISIVVDAYQEDEQHELVAASTFVHVEAKLEANVAF